MEDNKRELRELKKLLKRRGNKRLRRLGKISSDFVDNDEDMEIDNEHIDKYSSKKYNGLSEPL